jgi:hypothetical protein
VAPAGPGSYSDGVTVTDIMIQEVPSHWQLPRCQCFKLLCRRSESRAASDYESSRRWPRPGGRFTVTRTASGKSESPLAARSLRSPPVRAYDSDSESAHSGWRQVGLRRLGVRPAGESGRPGSIMIMIRLGVIMMTRTRSCQ